MRRRRAIGAASLVVTVGLFSLVLNAAEPNRSAEVKAILEKPPREYSSVPLWVWNDLLTDEQIISTMRDLALQDVKQVFVHPRPGLITPYLSDEWFRLWKLALKTAESLDMNVWIYDENSYPSGFAGGWVPESMPESVGRGLQFGEAKSVADIPKTAVAVFRLVEDRYESVSQAFSQGERLSGDRFLFATLVRANPSPWHAGRSYVDLIYPGVTQKFLEVTLDAYAREVGEAFGKRVPGSFTDEPRLLSAGQITWTDDLAERFKERFGYDLLDHLPSLIRHVGDWKQIRHDYYGLLLELFIERWAKPYSEWCEKHGIEFTGHYWEHEWPTCRVVPDNMAMYAWHQRPAIDCLMNQYAEGTHAQFGNLRAVRELASVADQMGRPRTLCELYGAGGWDLRFQDMKRIADWLGVLGVNTFDEHLSYVSIRGARKMDHPQSFSYHEPWWDSYHIIARYLTRLSLVLSAGDRMHEILVLEPTSTAWMYQGDPTVAGHLEELGQKFFDFLKSLEAAQIEYDLGNEDIISRQGRAEGARLIVGQRTYHTVVLPPGCENIEGQTFTLLKDFAAKGGRILVCGAQIDRLDGRASDQVTQILGSSWQKVEPSQAADILKGLQDQAICIVRNANDTGILFHQRRRLQDGEILVLVNTSDTSPSSGSVLAQYQSAEAWNLETGKVEEIAFSPTENGLSLQYELPPVGSLVLFFGKDKREPAKPTVWKDQPIPVTIDKIDRLSPNVLTLDYLDVQIGDEIRQSIYFYQACDWVFKKHGWPGNPWDRAVQFKDEILKKTFPKDSGFVLTYRFVIREQVPKDLAIVIERPDLYVLSCNGQPVPLPSQRTEWWLDRAFGKIAIAPLAKVGENVVQLKAAPMTVFHEVASAYVLGDFALEAADKGFVIVPAQPLQISAEGWDSQGCPFYGHGMAYTAKVTIADPSGRYLVRLGKWLGSLAKVIVNGQEVGSVYRPPYECDITPAIKSGENTVTIVVIGTLKNTLGPHHAGIMRGSAWPHAFAQGPVEGPPPGGQYDTIGYGLFEPFSVVRQLP